MIDIDAPPRASARAAARSSECIHWKKIGMKAPSVTNSVAAHNSPPPAFVLESVYIEASGLWLFRIATPRNASTPEPRRMLSILAG